MVVQSPRVRSEVLDSYPALPRHGVGTAAGYTPEESATRCAAGSGPTGSPVVPAGARLRLEARRGSCGTCGRVPSYPAPPRLRPRAPRVRGCLGLRMLVPRVASLTFAAAAQEQQAGREQRRLQMKGPGAATGSDSSGFQRGPEVPDSRPTRSRANPDTGLQILLPAVPAASSLTPSVYDHIVICSRIRRQATTSPRSTTP